MRPVFLYAIIMWLLVACNSAPADQKNTPQVQHLLHDIAAVTPDSLINVVIEIPAGTNQKWEVDKSSGQVMWQQITADSFRVVDYLAYPANYGFIPQTLLPKAKGGDGDPVDVFVLGPQLTRASVVKVRIIGIIQMLDNNESDSKLLAVPADAGTLHVKTLDQLNTKYPGVTEIIELWLSHYKGPGEVKILSIDNESAAQQYLNAALQDYIADKEN